MKIYDENESLYRLTHLPAYATYLVNNFTDEYTRRQIGYARSMNLPLLRFFSHLSEEELFNFSRTGVVEFLSAIQENEVEAFVRNSMELWVANQLPNLQKLQVEAQDITLINHLRGKVLKSFLAQYTLDADNILQLVSEIDNIVVGITTTSADIYLQMMKEKIEEEAHFSHNMIQASPGTNFIYSIPQQKEIFITGKVKDVMDYTSEEILAMPNLLAQLCYEEDLPVVQKLLEDLLNDRSDNTYHADYRFRRKDGSYTWLRCYTVVYRRNEQGAPIEILGVAYDISKEKRIALALEKREKQLLEAQQIGKIGSYDWDLVHHTYESTPQLFEILEADHSQTFDIMMSKIHPADKPLVQHALAESMKTGKYECEYRYRAASGEKIIDSRGMVSYNDEGIPMRLIGTIQDVTARRQAEQELKTHAAAVEKSNEALQQFAHAASHDLKEPLRKIILFSNLVLDEAGSQLSERSVTYIGKIENAAQRLSEMVSSILTYSSIDSINEVALCSLNEAIETARHNLEITIQESGAVIETESLPLIEGNQLQLERLFQNLISNSLKFAKPEVSPHIQITHTIENSTPGAGSDKPINQIIINYIDNGIGFKQEFAENIFTIFKRLHTKTEYEGSGVGLAICRKIVEAHGGTIQAEGAPGVGARFIIRLPKPGNEFKNKH